MLNFTTDTTAYTSTTRITRTSNFTNFQSKKQLNNSNFLDANALQFVNSIAHIFTLSVHNGKRYVACTLYYSTTKTYAFIVLDLYNNSIATADSIAHAKQAITQLVAQQAENA